MSLEWNFRNEFGLGSQLCCRSIHWSRLSWSSSRTYVGPKMALKNVVLLLALLSAVFSLVDSKNSRTVTIISEDRYNSRDDVVVVDGEILDASRTEERLVDRADVDVELEEVEEEESMAVEEDDSFQDSTDEDQVDTLPPVHPLARILTSRSSKWCWSSKTCKKFYNTPGCCKHNCVNLASDNSNCGSCGKSCNTKEGYRCTSGKCKKPRNESSYCGRHNQKCMNGYTCCNGKCVDLNNNNSHCGNCNQGCNAKGYSCKSGKCVKPPASESCGRDSPKCKSGQSCCKGKCVNLSSDSNNCGQCGNCCAGKKGYSCKYGKCMKATPPASECGKDRECKSEEKCCKGKCINFKLDDRNCGECGKSCGFGKKCCDGYCVNVLGSDRNHCGACGKKCRTTCKFGMCGYGQ